MIKDENDIIDDNIIIEDEFISDIAESDFDELDSPGVEELIEAQTSKLLSKEEEKELSIKLTEGNQANKSISDYYSYCGSVLGLEHAFLVFDKYLNLDDVISRLLDLKEEFNYESYFDIQKPSYELSNSSLLRKNKYENKLYHFTNGYQTIFDEIMEKHIYKIDNKINLSIQLKNIKNSLIGLKNEMDDLINQTTDKLAEYERLVNIGFYAKNKIVESNTGLVGSIARKFTNRGIDYVDLFQEGSIGLIIAAEKFDYRLGYRFSTYAQPWVFQTIRRAILNNAKTIRIPIYRYADIRKYKATVKKLGETLGRTPSIFEISKEMGETEEEVLIIKNLGSTMISIDKNISGSEETLLKDLFADTESSSPDELFSTELLDEFFDDFLKRYLTEREEFVFRKHNAISEDKRKYGFEEIGKEINLSKERVRVIYNNAENKLILHKEEIREYLKGNKL
jgi:RNA polymerase sigma factor (sigma-70 family)